MSSSCFYCSRKIAYVSLSVRKTSPFLESVREYCLTLPYEVDIFAENYHPSESTRPLLDKIVCLIKNDEVSELILPNIYHITAGDLKKENQFLELLKKHTVKLTILDQQNQKSSNRRGNI